MAFLGAEGESGGYKHFFKMGMHHITASKTG